MCYILTGLKLFERMDDESLALAVILCHIGMMGG